MVGFMMIAAPFVMLPVDRADAVRDHQTGAR